MFRKSVVVLMMAAAVAACGDDDPKGPDVVQSEFALDITGALTERAAGAAWFGADEDENGQPIWALLLGEDTARHVVIAGKEGASRPGAGSYDVADPMGEASGWQLVHLVSDGDELEEMYMGESGTVTVTVSTDEEVRGTLEFRAVSLFSLLADTIEVTGTFTAVPAPTGGQASAALSSLSVRPGI